MVVAIAIISSTNVSAAQSSRALDAPLEQATFSDAI